MKRNIQRSKTPQQKAAEAAALARRTHKACSGCGELRERAEFRVTKNSRDGMVGRCKPCEAAWHRDYFQANREVILERNRDKYWADPDTKRAANRRWNLANRERRIVASKAWYAANKEHVAALHRAWNAANPEARARLTREWRAANPERELKNARAWRAANRDRLRELGREAYAANPLKFIELAHRRRATIAEATIGPIDYAALWDGLCGICQEDLDAQLAHPDPMSKSIDHIVPLARGGPHSQDNLQWAHLSCNVSKGARQT